LNFHSATMDWLFVAGAKAIFKGSGTVNEQPDYGFMIIIGLLLFGVLGRTIAPPIYFLRELILTMLGLW